ncbi:RyR domain-containing protein [Oceanidesulfovibrio marinus]|uniref:RelA/SpoT domain-containing protein n=1 Tax=Oceanidesulfovibrio marinus TaxID=370038 RepID=A0A6P1ZEV1_9BACT|nr:RyR domain-containing protein [Oceanidesulfovibrio marinus]TVM32141.1 hypothetical protein DQK91_16560 [Oceanidesulfovibrio marinus]
MPTSNDVNKKHIDTFSTQLGNYKTFCDSLSAILKHAADELGIHPLIQARAKDIPGFAEKIVRKGYTDPFRQMTDLCGARVITQSLDDVQAVCEWVRERFLVDEPNSEDKLGKLRDAEFGYRSVHFVVSLRKDMMEPLGLGIPEFLYETMTPSGADGAGLVEPVYKAEIQVRTLLQHAWASVVHDNLYKSPFKNLKRKWSRDASRISALLENADECFAELLREIESFKHQYGSYMTVEQMQKKIDELAAVREFVPKTTGEGAPSKKYNNLIRRIARLYMAMGEHEKAAAELEPIAGADSLAKRDLAEALIKSGDEQKIFQGRGLLLELEPREQGDTTPDDPIAQDLLAETYAHELEIALEHSRRAYEANPTEPGILRRYIERKILCERQCGFLSLMYPTIERTLQFSRERARLEVGLPWTLHDIGMLELLRNKPYLALEAFIEAMTRSETLQGVDELITLLDALDSAASHAINGLEWSRAFLLLAKAVKQQDTPLAGTCRDLFGRNCQGGLQGPVVIVAGGCDPNVSEKIAAYESIITTAFKDFTGTVICGGTMDGISGMIGNLPGAGESFRLLSYLPAEPVERVQRHIKYEIRDARDHDFSPRGPIQGWMDIIASGIEPRDVRVVGINGGQLSAVEYMIAASLGATVGLMRGSGREASRLLDKPFWSVCSNILPLPADAMTVWEYLRPKTEPSLPPSAQDALGKQIHEDYRNNLRKKSTASDPSLNDWGCLDDDLKRSNIDVAAHYEAKLRLVGLTISAKAPEEIELYQFSEAQVARMAEFEHARWNLERLQAGWRLGTKDVEAKLSPYLVGWNELPEEIRQYDVDIVENIPKRLREIGYEICVGK